MPVRTVGGLTSAEVAERIARGQTNAYEAASSRSAWSIIRANVFNRFNAIIGACFILLLAIGRWQDTFFGFAAIGNIIIGTAQEYSAKRALDRLALVHAPHARVMRDGREQDIAIGEVVLDDVLVLRAGDQVPADAEVIESTGLQLDESMLTGESDPIDRSPGDEVLSGSIVVGGEGLARAAKVGADAFANRFADEAKRFSLVRSELRASIDRVLRWMSWIIPPVMVLVLNAQMVVAGGWETAFATGTWPSAVVSTVAAIVAMVPLGLVLITSITFAVGAVKLSRSSVLVNELAAVEGLARVDIICLDKTGTLTEGEIVFDDTHLLDGPQPDGWAAVLGWYGAAPDANATARCLAEHYPAADIGPETSRVAFTSARKWSAVSFGAGSPAAGTWVLGAPEMVFPAPPPGSPGQAAVAKAAELAATGRRTLVLAHTPAGSDGSLDADRIQAAGLTPVALLTFREQIRPDAAPTLAYFAAQGVDVRIISGDNPRTVAAIARDLGLDAGEGFDARELPESEEELRAILEREIVFGRVTPEQKKRIVLALKDAGRTVAMTGDGVNDALAIKEADLGIAMNSGSAATKAVARIVLLDSSFAHLPAVVAEGRRVIANIERVSMLFLTKTTYATTLALVFGALMMEFPFLPRQESIVDGLTIGLPAFFLALMPNLQRYRPGFLRRSLSFAVPAGLVIGTALSLYTAEAIRDGVPTEELRTGTTLVLVILGLWVLVVLARPLTWQKVLVVGAMMIGLIAVYSIPVLTEFLQFVDPGIDTAVNVLQTVVLAIIALELVRWFHRWYLRRLDARSRTSERSDPSTAR